MNYGVHLFEGVRYTNKYGKSIFMHLSQYESVYMYAFVPIINLWLIVPIIVTSCKCVKLSRYSPYLLLMQNRDNLKSTANQMKLTYSGVYYHTNLLLPIYFVDKWKFKLSRHCPFHIFIICPDIIPEVCICVRVNVHAYVYMSVFYVLVTCMCYMFACVVSGRGTEGRRSRGATGAQPPPPLFWIRIKSALFYVF